MAPRNVAVSPDAMKLARVSQRQGSTPWRDDESAGNVSSSRIAARFGRRRTEQSCGGARRGRERRCNPVVARDRRFGPKTDWLQPCIDPGAQAAANQVGIVVAKADRARLDSSIRLRLDVVVGAFSISCAHTTLFLTYFIVLGDAALCCCRRTLASQRPAAAQQTSEIAASRNPLQVGPHMRIRVPIAHCGLYIGALSDIMTKRTL